MERRGGSANSSIGRASLPFGVGKEVQPVMTSDKTFEDVKGAREAKQDLQEVIKFLKEPERFTKLGGKLPKGVLLTGTF